MQMRIFRRLRSYAESVWHRRSANPYQRATRFMAFGVPVYIEVPVGWYMHWWPDGQQWRTSDRPGFSSLFFGYVQGQRPDRLNNGPYTMRNANGIWVTSAGSYTRATTVETFCGMHRTARGSWMRLTQAFFQWLGYPWGGGYLPFSKFCGPSAESPPLPPPGGGPRVGWEFFLVHRGDC